MSKFIAVSSLLIIMLLNSHAQWGRVEMGAGGSWMRGLVVGPVKSFGEVSVFASNQDGNLYEFSWLDSAWVTDTIATSYWNVERMSIGNARRAAYNQLYVASCDTHVYEFVWNWSEARWEQNRIETPYRWNHDAVVGDGRNDDTDRLYVASAECIYEYTWNGADWDTQYVGTAHMVYTNWIYDLAIGRGRDDDTIRIYASGQNIPGEYGAYEFTWNGTAWIREPITFLAAHWQNYAIEVGDGRNDGVQRVYIGGNNGILFEFTWNGTGWDSIAVHDDGGTKWTIIIGNGRSDDPPHNRVYEACHDGHVYESTWNDSTATWNNVDVGIGIGLGIDNNMWGIGIGKGRNDGIERVFAGNYDHRVYEFSYPGVGVAEIVYRHPQMSILAYPNPFNSVCFIEIPANTKIKIVDITGRCIKTIANPSNSNMAFHWHPDKSLVSGIFLVYIENEGETIARQVFYIK